LYDRKILGTLHDRVGEEEQLMRKGEIQRRRYANGVWGRYIYQNGDYNSSGIFRKGPDFDFIVQAVQIGLDVYHAISPFGADFAGIFGTAGEVHGHVDHLKITHAGRNRSDNYAFGSYYTHFSPLGWYTDAVAQYTYHD